jgi:hypothetical protein
MCLMRKEHDTAPFTEYSCNAFQIAAGACFSIAGTLFLGWQGLVAASKGSWIGAALLALFAGAFTFIGVQTARMRIAVRGEEFEVCALFGGTTLGTAGDFIGYTYDRVWFRWELLRRSDLRIVNLPWFSPAGYTGPDAAVRQWLKTHFAQVEGRRCKAVARGKTLPSALALRRLVQTRSEQIGKMSMRPERDLELAQAAYAITVHGYSGASAELLRLLRDLPGLSLARLYVAEALYTYSDPETLPGLLAVLNEPRCAGVRERLAATICAVAQAEHEQLLRTLQKDASLYVQTHAQAALARIKAQPQS